MVKPHRPSESLITWERARGIFNDPKPPESVWERQFDYFDDQLDRLARTPYYQIDFGDLWYYHHDLAYVELQQDLFNYLFPVCLMDWHASLMQNQSCSHGDSEFHYGVLSGNILEKMVTPQQRGAIFEFIRDSFLERLDAERGFAYEGSRTPAYGWIGRFNSIGLILPKIDLLWEPWWTLDTPGRAVAALQYCSGLMYLEGENPLCGRWKTGQGGGGPYLWETDSLILDMGWKPENLDFLSRTLTADFVDDRVLKAVARLEGEPEWEQARRLENDLPERRELVSLRVAELPNLIAKDTGPDGWSV
ncbi:hypothetical protein SAMN05444166_1701 [Singulisphaera sp. GP187]|uniref:hypothetical protein n=1 Tax=Singulisphaera sp. GP187 TaxID=1882752 RepID=UPI0009283475|nr:hypothetical protein [Singulisphaera sp. GP187]SIN93909.1 hypothetical protein SAMN05444166_1701 [Singulisphaera sp. GP187]